MGATDTAECAPTGDRTSGERSRREPAAARRRLRAAASSAIATAPAPPTAWPLLRTSVDFAGGGKPAIRSRGLGARARPIAAFAVAPTGSGSATTGRHYLPA